MDRNDASNMQAFSPDMRLPPEMAAACEKAGMAKAARRPFDLVVLGVLAGAFIAFGALFMTLVLTGAGVMPWGVARLLAGLVFSLGLITVIVAGAELFTGDTLMVMAYAGRRITLAALLRAWFWVYLGNIVGALGTAALVFLAGQHGLAGGALGRTALEVAGAKAALPAGELFFRAVLCNVLVCLAVWMSFGARSAGDKVMVLVLPVALFVAAGFEHSIANLYLLPYALALKAFAPELAGPAPASLNAGNALFNIALSTVGNLIGGSVMVGTVYWFLYLRPSGRVG